MSQGPQAYKLAEGQSPIESPSAYISIRKGSQRINIINPSNVIVLPADSPTVTIFHKPEQHDDFLSHLTRDPHEAITSMARGEYSSPGGDPQIHSLYLSWSRPELLKDISHGVHPPWWDLEAKDTASTNILILKGSRETYERVANAWRPNRSWYEILASVSALQQHETIQCANS
jgi:hypothetical protein